jgi:hypothetical protein
MSERTAKLVVCSFIASIIFFASGAFLGFFLTAFIPMGPSSWPWVVYGRIVWQLGGAVWLGVSGGLMLARSLKGRLLWLVILSLIGGLLCLNPLRDVIENQGPLRLEGAVLVDFDEDRVSMKSGARGIVVRLRLRDQHGREHSVKARGHHANRWQRALAGCEAKGWRPDQPVDVTALEHLGTLFALRCQGER